MTLDAYLEANLPGYQGPSALSPFSEGQSNPTFLLSARSGDYVLRRKPEGVLLKGAHAVEREYRVQKALWTTDVPVPRVLHLCEDPSVIGSAFYVMEHVTGRIFWDPALPDLAPGDRGRVYDEMNRVLAAIHSVDLDATGLADFGKPGDYFARQLARWSEAWRTTRTEPVPEMEALIDWLTANAPADDGEIALVHGDYRIDNLMFAPDRLEIIAVFDWELSTLGHPLADLAYQIIQRKMGRDWHLKGLAGLDPVELGIPSEDDYVAAYAARRGLPVRNWTYAKAFAFFRFAAICQGVRKRGLDGNAASPDAARVGAMAAPLARLGWALVEG